MKKFLIVSMVFNILLGIILIGILNTTYEYKYCNNEKCIISKQKIFDYIVGRE